MTTPKNTLDEIDDLFAEFEAVEDRRRAQSNKTVIKDENEGFKELYEQAGVPVPPATKKSKSLTTPSPVDTLPKPFGRPGKD